MQTIVAYFLLPMSLLLSGSLLVAQAVPVVKPSEFNHIAIFVQDLQRSADFYEKVMGLEKIPEPFKDGRHVWFRVGEHGQLHVVGGATQPAPTTIDVHNAFRVASMPEFMAHLDKMQVKYRSFKGDAKSTSRPDGITQIYFQDPDGYWIEVNDDKF